MRRRLRYRLLQACALLAVTVFGIWGYREVVRPDPQLLGRLAKEKLQEIFDPGVVEYEHLEIDLVEGVRISKLRVFEQGRDEPSLEADHVEVRHDLLAIASGLYRPETIVIRGARIVAKETELGMALDFPFQLESDEQTGRLPAIELQSCELRLRARELSERLRPGSEVTLGDIWLTAVPTPSGGISLKGNGDPLGLGQEGIRILVYGIAEPDADVLELWVDWSPLLVSPELLDALGDSIAAPLRSQRGQRGDLLVSLTRHPDIEQGELVVRARYGGEVRIDLSQLPAAEVINTSSREQIDRLLQRADLDITLEGGTVNLDGLLKALGGGRVAVTGFIREEDDKFGEPQVEIDLDIVIKGLRLEEADVRDSLAPDGREILETFDPAGVVDAEVYLSKKPGGDVEWQVDALLEQARWRYVGPRLPDGTYEGFPYPVEDGHGRIHIEKGEVWFDGIWGFSGTDTEIRLRSYGEEAWTGGETGRIRFGEGVPDIRITIEAKRVPTDEVLETAVAGSEFSDLFDHFWINGEIDQVLVDVIAVPERDTKAYAEVHITLEDEEFRYARFPMLLEEVKGWVTMTRPFIGPQERGQEFSFDVVGKADGADVALHATYRGHNETGHLHVEAKRISLAGALADAVQSSEITEGAIADAWRWLDPRGRANVTLEVPLENEPGEVKLVAELLKASIRLDAEASESPIEITELLGTLRVEDDVVHLEGLQGRMLDTAVIMAGTIEGGPTGSWDVRIETDMLRVTPELLIGLEGLAGESLLPEGIQLGTGARLALEVHLTRKAGEDEAVEVDVVASGLDGVLHLPEGSALALRAESIHVRGDEVALKGVYGEAPGIRLELDTAHASEGGITGRMTLHLEEIQLTSEILGLLPEEARDILSDWVEGRRVSSEAMTLDARADGSLRLDGDLILLADPGATAGDAARGGLEVRPLELSSPDGTGQRTLRGRVLLHGFTFGGDVPVEDVDGEVEIQWLRPGDPASGRGVLRLRSAKIFDLSVRDATVPVTWEQGILRADPLTGIVAEGRLQGRLILHTGEPTAYEGEVRIDGFRLESLREDLAPTGPPLSGLGKAEIEFQNRSGETRDLTARGSLSVRDGNLGDLPVVANIFAFFAEVLAVDPPPRFERLDATFTLRDEVVHLSRFDLAGPLFDMPGRGTLDLGGYVDLVFTPDIIKSFLVPGIMQFPVVGDVLDAILREDLLYAIRLRGDVSSAEPEVVALPPLGLGDERPFEGTGTPQPPPRRLPRWFR